MLGDYNPLRDKMRHVDWLSLFADREESRGKIEDFIRQLADKYAKPDCPILQFYGIKWTQRRNRDPLELEESSSYKIDYMALFGVEMILLKCLIMRSLGPL